MSQVGIRCFHRGCMSFEECDKCSREPLHPCEYPRKIIQILHADMQKSRDRTTFSPSSLTGCFRRAVLQSGKDWYQDIDASYKMLRGTMVHALMEQKLYEIEDDTLLTLYEQRFSTTIDTKYGQQVVSGQPDMVEIVDVVDGVAQVRITDWKTTSTIKHEMVEPYTDNYRQIAMYGWLVSKCLPEYFRSKYSEWYPDATPFHEVQSVDVLEYEIFYVSMQKGRRFTSLGSLTTRGKLTKRSEPKEWEMIELYPLPYRTVERTEKYIRMRIEQRMDAEETLPPPLEGDEADIKCPSCAVRDYCMNMWSKENGNV